MENKVMSQEIAAAVPPNSSHDSCSEVCIWKFLLREDKTGSYITDHHFKCFCVKSLSPTYPPLESSKFQIVKEIQNSYFYQEKREGPLFPVKAVCFHCRIFFFPGHNVIWLLGLKETLPIITQTKPDLFL
jgi:hypothetical protein